MPLLGGLSHLSLKLSRLVNRCVSAPQGSLVLQAPSIGRSKFLAKCWQTLGGKAALLELEEDRSFEALLPHRELVTAAVPPSHCADVPEVSIATT